VTTTVRWGLLGTARINHRVIPAMRAARRSVLAAVASRSAERAAAHAREWQIPTAHGSYDALLRDRSVDAIYIPLPNALHVEWTLRALDAGKHVLCEKPLALRADDVDRIEAVARDRQLVAAEAFMYRHEPLLEPLRTLLANRVVGRVRTISASFTFSLTRTPDVRLDPLLGGGSLWDVGCYAVSIVRFVAQQEPVTATGMATMNSDGVDESFAGVLAFADGTLATIASSFRAAYQTSLEVAGSEGILRVRNPFKPGLRESIEIERGDEVERIVVEGSPVLFVRLIEDFVGATLDGRAPTVSLHESRGNAAALAALYESAKTGRAVSL
jgi:xylose dehydrogenase (NAD/NADP)